MGGTAERKKRSRTEGSGTSRLDQRWSSHSNPRLVLVSREKQTLIWEETRARVVEMEVKDGWCGPWLEGPTVKSHPCHSNPYGCCQQEEQPRVTGLDPATPSLLPLERIPHGEHPATAAVYLHPVHSRQSCASRSRSGGSIVCASKLDRSGDSR